MEDKLEKLFKETTMVSPVLMVSDIDKMCNFYQKAFNIQTAHLMKNKGGRNVSAILLFHESTIFLREEGQFGLVEKAPVKTKFIPPISLILPYKNVDEQFEIAKASGVKVIFEPTVMPWGGRLCKVEDIEGYIWFLESKNENLKLSEIPVVDSY